MAGKKKQSTTQVPIQTQDIGVEQSAPIVVDEDGVEKQESQQKDIKYEDIIFQKCFQNNFPYFGEISNQIMVMAKDQSLTEDEAYEKYCQIVKEDPVFCSVTFFEQLRRYNFDKIYSDEFINLQLSEEDKKCRLSVIEICGADPFADDSPEERPKLYRDAATILTDAMRKDLPKQKAALTIVRNYNNLDKYQKAINEIMQSGAVDEATQKQLDQYIKIQKTIQDSINATAEKNNFTVKGIGTDGKGMLSDVMAQISEKGIDEGVTNFYDIATSKSIGEIANISFKAQLNQINLSKTDYADIIGTQNALIREAQDKARKAVEALRVAKEKIKKQELLLELERDYRKKGISEREINDFVQREYNLYDISGNN